MNLNKAKKEDLLKNGFVNKAIDKNIDILKSIREFKEKKNAVILAHFYTTPELQDIADYVGDSLKLSQIAAETTADVIVFIGVHFMAETAKILSPNKKVLLPDLNSGCSLAESIPAADFKKFIDKNPNHIVISYVNTSADIKALTDIIVTSTNAKKIVDSLPKNKKIIFAPDKNLGDYINKVTGRNMLLWNGACHVHEAFNMEAIKELKNKNKGSKILAHPECEKSVLSIADHIGSTTSILNFSKNNKANTFIVATELGIIHQMQKASPKKKFIPAPLNNSITDCNFMKLNNINKLYNCMKYDLPEITIDEKIRERAEIPIRRMLKISAELGL